mmetsp:Transcript_25581/g.81139  ORF Transcript_25581/g.81139 Transcript_25581/m.81139 type:complete len:241 (+) Transcript_25581:447-1169(+)
MRAAALTSAPSDAISISHRARTCSAMSLAGSRSRARSTVSLTRREISTLSELPANIARRPRFTAWATNPSGPSGSASMAACESFIASRTISQALTWSLNTASSNTWSEMALESRPSRGPSPGTSLHASLYSEIAAAVSRRDSCPCASPKMLSTAAPYLRRTVGTAGRCSPSAGADTTLATSRAWTSRHGARKTLDMRSKRQYEASMTRKERVNIATMRNTVNPILPRSGFSMSCSSDRSA